MTVLDHVSDRAESVAISARRTRAEMLLAEYPDLAEMRVVDLGGEARGWAQVATRPAELTIVNYGWINTLHREQWARYVKGDARDPGLLSGERFDLVYCNSVIEHVGGAEARRRLADTVHRLADQHWVQTPYRYFPLEPHALFPGLQFLPLRVKTWALERWPIGHMRGGDVVRTALDVELLTATEMRWLFPASRLLRERLGGLTKSLIATR